MLLVVSFYNLFSIWQEDRVFDGDYSDDDLDVSIFCFAVCLCLSIRKRC